MFEFVLAWIMLFVGIFTGDVLYFIASGVFDIAGYIGKAIGEGDKKR